ncbi:hypothetical protein ACFW04_013761 [Cataglyphis niger]
MNTLSWEKQITNMTNRIHSALYQLKLCRHLLPETLKSKLVISLIYPHVDYCCTAYTDMTTEQNLRLHKAVNACVRFIFNLRTDEYITPYYVGVGSRRWLKVDARRAYFVGCLLYKILESKQPSLLHSNFNYKIATSDRTQAPRDMLFLPQCIL